MLFVSIFHIITAEISIIPFLLNDIIGFYQYNYVSIILFITSILLCFMYSKFSINFQSYMFSHLAIGVIILLGIIFFDTINSIIKQDALSMKDSLMYSIKYCMVLILITIMFCRRKVVLKKFLNIYLKTTLFYSFISIITLIILIYDFGVVNNFITTNEDDSKIFSWPFYLSVVNITPTDQRFIFGLPLPMLYSWFLEPQFYSFYVLPSLYIIKYTELSNKKFYTIINVCGLLLTASLTTYVFLSVIMLLKVYYNLNRMQKPLFIFGNGLLLIFIVFNLEFDNKSIFYKFNSASPSASFTYNIVTSVLTGNSFIGEPLQLLRREIADKTAYIDSSSLITSVLIIGFIIFLVILLFKSFILQKHLNYLPLVLIAFLFKDMIMYIYMPLFIFIYLLLFVLNKKIYS